MKPRYKVRRRTDVSQRPQWGVECGNKFASFSSWEIAIQAVCFLCRGELVMTDLACLTLASEPDPEYWAV